MTSVPWPQLPVQGSAQSSAKSAPSGLWKGQIRIPRPGGTGLAGQTGYVDAAQTVNATTVVVTGTEKLSQLANLDANYWLDTRLSAGTLPEHVYVHSSDSLADGLAIARFPDTVLLTLAPPYEDLAATGILDHDEDEEDESWLDGITSRIYGFSALRDGWDSYRARRISPEAIRKATRLITLLADITRGMVRRSDIEVRVAPMSSGSIEFEMKHNQRELFIEIPVGTEGTYRVLRVWHEAGRETEQEYAAREPQLREVLSWIVRGS